MTNRACDKRKFNAEAYKYAQDEDRDEDFEGTETSEGAVWTVEEENEERVSYGKGTASY